MAIGDAIRKYQAQKEAAAAASEHAQDINPEPVATEPTQRAAEPTQEPSMAAVLQQAMALMAQLAADKSGNSLQHDATIGLIEKLITKTHPENVDHPGISVYSYPEGDMARPKPTLKCKTFWVGYELMESVLTPHEIDLLNSLVPGEYRVTKADGKDIPFRVKAKESDSLGADGTPTVEEMSVWFPCKGDQRDNHLSMVSYITQAMHGKIPSIEDALAELARLKAQLATAGVAA